MNHEKKPTIGRSGGRKSQAEGTANAKVLRWCSGLLQEEKEGTKEKETRIWSEM